MKPHNFGIPQGYRAKFSGRKSTVRHYMDRFGLGDSDIITGTDPHNLGPQMAIETTTYPLSDTHVDPQQPYQVQDTGALQSAIVSPSDTHNNPSYAETSTAVATLPPEVVAVPSSALASLSTPIRAVVLGAAILGIIWMFPKGR